MQSVGENSSGPVSPPEGDTSFLPTTINEDSPTVAVASAMASTEGGRAAGMTEAEPELRMLRPLGRHMLGLLEAPGATQQQRVGARIILMRGTTAERRLLFLHDALSLATAPQQAPEAKKGQVSIPEMASLKALAQHGEGGPALKRLNAAVANRKTLSEEKLRKAVGEVVAEVLPTLHPDDVVSLLRTKRQLYAEGSLFGDRKTAQTVLQTLVEKGRQLNPGAIEARALVAEAVMQGADQARDAAGVMKQHGFLQARRAARLEESAGEARVASYNLLPQDLWMLCVSPRNPGAILPERLHRVVDAIEAGLTYSSLTGILKAEPNFLEGRYIVSGGGADVAVLNRVGEMLHQNGPETKLIEQLRSGWILGAKTHELTIATELVDRPALSGFLHNTTASAHLVNLIKGEEPAERQRTMTLLEGFASTGHLDSFVLSIEGTDQLEAFKRVLASPDSPAYKELHELIKIPYFAEMVAEQGDNLYTVNSLHDRRLLLDSEPDSPYAAMRSELIELSRVSGLDKMEDSVLAKEMIRLYFNDVSAMGRRSDSDAQFEQYLAQARTVSEVLLFPDIQEVFSALSGRNPELARVVAGELLHGDNTDIIARVVALHGLAELPPQSFTQNELRAITRAAPNIEPFEGIALYSKLGLAEVTGPKGMLTSQADKVLAWALGSEGGSVDQKRALLMSEQARQFYMIANKKGHRMYATGFAGQLDQGRTTDEITRYMTECVETSRDVELDRVILEASSGAYLPDVIWRVILQSDSPRAAANTLSTGLLANRGPLLRELAKYDQAIIEGMVEGYIRSEDALQYAQEWQAVLTDTHVLELVGSQSLQYALRQQILTPMLQSPHPLAIATHFERQLVQQRPLWYANYETSRTLIDGDKMFVEDMVVGELPVGLPAINRQLSAGEVEALLDGTLLRPIAEMSVEEKKFYIGDSVTGDLDNLETVRMSELDSDTRQNILIYRMFETVERSRSEPIRMRASQRNMAQVFAGEPLWQEGDLVHFTDMLNMQSLLLSGNLASEVVGGTIANRDTYPFNVDFWRVENDLLSLPSNEERFNALSLAYGDVALHYRRGPGAYRAGEEFGSGNSRFANPHYLMFAGMPSTEVSAMTVRTQSALEPLRKMLIETGIYVPLYTPDGTLQFTPEEFITRYNDGNYAAVQPETVDSVFVVRDTKKGSNEGAEVYIPSADGQPIKWYAKFVDNSLEHSSEHIWTEFLGDGIYQEVHPELVPESRVVRIGGRLARISRMVEPGGRVTNAGRNAGFVLDCLLANWDAVYNGEDNLVASATSVDTALRVDNGGALDFSGGGARKNQLFGDEVLELGVGSDDRVLGGGMRQKYPDLTDKDIRVQAQELSERLTDDAIDRRVDRVRRSSADRAMLKRTLKARRDYIVAYAAEL